METTATISTALPPVELAVASPIRVLLVDDHTVLRDGLRGIINQQPDLQVVGEAGDGEAGAKLALELRPDVVIMDVSMPRLGGVEAATRLSQATSATTQRPTAVLALTMHEERSFLREMLKAGASGYMLKRSAGDELARAIRVVASGGVFLDPNLGGTMVDTLTGSPLRGEITGSALSEREEQVLRLIAQGYANKEIAAKLTISIKTVETYKARSMEKLGLNSRTDIIRYALKHDWLHHV